MGSIFWVANGCDLTGKQATCAANGPTKDRDQLLGAHRPSRQILTPMIRFDSLLRLINSLFVRIVSLLICVGNCARSACSTEVSYSEIDPHRPKTAEFPVKFPVSRESVWRPARSALRRQPRSHST
jgi:hypothetical protein